MDSKKTAIVSYVTTDKNKDRTFSVKCVAGVMRKKAGRDTYPPIHNKKGVSFDTPFPLHTKPIKVIIQRN